MSVGYPLIATAMGHDAPTPVSASTAAHPFCRRSHRSLDIADTTRCGGMECSVPLLFRTLESYGLHVNPTKSSLLIKVRGKTLEKLLRDRTVWVKRKAQWRFRDRDRTYLVPMETQISYLGTIIPLQAV